MKLHKNFEHFRYSLRVNQKNILGEYSSFVKSSTCNYLQLDWINLYRNDFVPNSLQCRRFLWACNLLAKAPCWNFPKRGGDGASQRERGGGGEREREYFFLPSPSPFPSFALAPTARVAISTLPSLLLSYNQRWRLQQYCEHEQGFAHPKYACTAGYVPKRPVTSVSTCCLANSSWKSYTLQPLNSVSFGKALHRRETLLNKIHSVSTLNIIQEECEKLQRVQAQGRESKGGASMFLVILHVYSTIIVNHVHCKWLHDNIRERLNKSTSHTPRSKERWTR